MKRRIRSQEEIKEDILLGSKVCPVCKQRKVFSDYNKDSAAPDKVVKVCKACINRIRYNGRSKPSQEEVDCSLRTKTKVCTVCKKRLSHDLYHNSSRSKDGKGYRCIECDNKARKDYRDANKDRHATKRRIVQIKSRFNLEEQKLRDLMDEQKGCCAICDESLVDPSKDSTKQYGIDHNHNTGEVRGLLCLHCNAMLGQAMDSPSVLLAGYNYLINNGYYGDK